jgi:regulator of sigma E protease
MEILVKAGQFLLSLSLLIVLHELGHFIPARLFKTRVEKFFLFFDIKGALWQKKIGETVYGIGWLPLGGYVKISGMIDESMDKEQMTKPAQPWEFRSKPAWQRLIIMLGGVTVNLILGVLIYGLVFFVFGGQVTSAEVLRDGQVTTLDFPTELGQVLVDRKDDIPKGSAPFSVNFPTIIDRVMPASGAERAGLEPGDGILAVNGESTPYFQTLVEALGRHAGDTVTLTVTRSGANAAPNPELGQALPTNGTLALDAEVDASGKLGFYPIEVESLDGFQFVERSFGPVDALSEGARKTKTTLTNYVSSLRFLFRPGGTQQLGGFITLGSIFSPEWDWRSFWNITALLSIILAFMNLLPIPALDGGHVMFLLYEMISGRKPSDKVMEYGQLIGLLLVGSLMLLANGNDLWKWFTGRF